MYQIAVVKLTRFSPLQIVEKLLDFGKLGGRDEFALSHHLLGQTIQISLWAEVFESNYLLT